MAGADLPIHLLIPMSGQGTRFRKEGYADPKPLILANGKTIISRLLEALPERWPAHFVLAENHRETKLPEHLKDLRPQSSLCYVDIHQLGPGKAILKGLENIPDEHPVLVSYCDYSMVWDSARFETFVRETACDACLVSYRGFHAHYSTPTKYAYSRLNGERVVEVREKGSFTDNRENEEASCGAYYFRTAKLLRETLLSQMVDNRSLNGEFYTSLTVETLLLKNPHAHVRIFEIQGFFQWGTPDDLRLFEFWERSFRAWNRNTGHPYSKIPQLLMPMAGEGSRFKALTAIPKPLIPIAGVPMFRAAEQSFPEAKNKVFVALKNIAAKLELEMKENDKVTILDRTPSGQALSTEAGLEHLNLDEEVIVTSCDHAVVIDPKHWAEFDARKSEFDAMIFTFTGYEPAKNNPEAYAWVLADVGPSPFASVRNVSVKKSISTSPAKDPVLVGSFWFRSGKLLKNSINKLKESNHRVNGELYLDSVFNFLIADGAKVGIFPLAGYICWGTPELLAEALYWQEIFSGRSLVSRPRFPGIPTL